MEDLTNRQIIAVINFEKKNIAGIESEVLVLGAVNKDNTITLPDADGTVITTGNLSEITNLVDTALYQRTNKQSCRAATTDNLASDAYNLELSRERAESVKEYLVGQDVDANKLRTVGMGESEPIADNSTELGRFRNRRIEFTVYDESMATEDNNGISLTAGNEGDIDMNNDIDADMNMPDPDLNPLDNNNDDILPDSDDPSQGIDLDPTN